MVHGQEKSCDDASEEGKKKTLAMPVPMKIAALMPVVEVKAESNVKSQVSSAERKKETTRVKCHVSCAMCQESFSRVST